MTQTISPIPQTYTTVTPYLVVKGAAQAIEFYRNAFGARETFRINGPNGRIAHADVLIGNGHVMISDDPESGDAKGARSSTFLYVEDVDAVFQQAVRAGAKETQPLQDMFWGDRYGRLLDPFGQEWQLATHKEDVSDEEMKRRMAAMRR